MTKNNAIAVTSIIAGVILVIALLFLFVFSPVRYSSGNTVTVQGVAEIKAVPDLVSVYFSIDTKAKTSSEAKDANNEIYEKLVDALIAEGFTENEVKTESFNIYPEYDWSSSTQKLIGYRATHSVKIQLPTDDFDKLSEVIDAGADSGAGISYINFELTQASQNKYKAEALKLASGDAQIKADSVAAGFGKSAGKLLSVSVSDFGYYPWNVYTSKSYDSASGAYLQEDVEMARETVANLSPDEQEITASVSATFRIR